MSITDNSLTDAAGSFLGKKYGPLPLGAWLVVAGGTAYFVRKYMDKQSATPATVGDAGTDTTDLSPGSSPAYSMPGNAGNAVNNGVGGITTGGDVTVPTTNVEWQSRALGILVGLHYSAYDATMALQTYLSGGTLSSQQNAMVTAAIQAIGAPPENTGTINPSQPSAPTPSKPAVQRGVIAVRLVGGNQPTKVGDRAKIQVQAHGPLGGPLSVRLERWVMNPSTHGQWVIDNAVTTPSTGIIGDTTYPLPSGTSRFEYVNPLTGTTSNTVSVTVR